MFKRLLSHKEVGYSKTRAVLFKGTCNPDHVNTQFLPPPFFHHLGRGGAYVRGRKTLFDTDVCMGALYSTRLLFAGFLNRSHVSDSV